MYVIMNVKEHIQLWNVLMSLKTFYALQKCVWLPDKEYIIDQRCKRINVAVKCKLLVNVTENFSDICKKYICQVRTTEVVINLKKYGCQCKIFITFTLHFMCIDILYR